jgi:hypothetical protein
MNTIILTERNIEKNTNNSSLLYSFQGSTTFKKSTIALASVNLFFSWFNITKKYNNTLSYTWFDINGILNQIIEITIPDGYYSVNTLNEFLQSEFVKKGHYLIDNSNNKYIYFLEIQSNSTYYSIQLNLYPMITNENSNNYTRGGTDWMYPLISITPQFIFSDKKDFKILLGFTLNTYPENTSSQIKSFLSENTPRLNPVSSIFVKCSLCNNKYSTPNDILYNFTTGSVEFGNIIDVQPRVETFLSIRDQSVYDIRIQFLDQDLNTLDIRDPQMVVVLSIKEDMEKN